MVGKESTNAKKQKLNPFQKTGSIDKLFISLENQQIKFQIRNRSRSCFS